MEDPTVVRKFAAYYVETYITFSKDVCVFVLFFRSYRVLAELHAKEKCACDQLANDCVQMCVFLLVDMED